MQKRIEEKLRQNLEIEFLEVKNNSYLHHGHAGDDGSGETHFAITVKSIDLNDLNKVAAHRKINSLVQDEFKRGLHALEIKIVM